MVGGIAGTILQETTGEKLAQIDGKTRTNFPILTLNLTMIRKKKHYQCPTLTFLIMIIIKPPLKYFRFV